MCNFKEVPESPPKPLSGGGSRRLFDGGNRRDWFPRGWGRLRHRQEITQTEMVAKK